ncbi:MAG: hypothetical protein L3K17_06485 [Thermoplasmata archaeon]|nr:hypothetical protein [Thermoplasmata archaeon]
MPPRRGARRGPLDPPQTPARVEKVLAGRAWMRGKLQPIEIGIDGEGRIARIAKSIRGGVREDLGDRVLIPAATDLHVHLREPSTGPRVESFRSGTEAAALGGVTAVADMPNTEPPIDRPARVREKQDRARGELAVDLILYAAVGPQTAIESLGAVAGAFKLYLSPTTGIEQPPEEGSVPSLLARVAATGLSLTVHAEEPLAFRTVTKLDSPIAWDAHRPIEAEQRAIAGLLPGPPGLRLHIAHVSAPAVANSVRGSGHSFEVTPQHLLLAARRDDSARFKVNPPLRPPAIRAGLWDEFRAGRVPVLSSDHAPHPALVKDQEFARAPSGMPGVETTLPLLLEKVREGELGLDVLQSAACDRPARWLGLSHGRLAVGERANLLAVDFRRHRPIQAARLRTACGWSAFEGWEAVFPERHYRDGQLIVADGEFVGARNGVVVRPDYARA